MGKPTRRKCVIIVPDDYWTSSLDNIDWVWKETDAKRT